MKNLIPVLIIFFFVTSCNPKEKQISSTEKFIQDTILSLPEVQEMNQLVDSITKKQQQISLIIEPSTESADVWTVQVGYNGKERFETYFHFFVNPSTKEIWVQNIENAASQSLSEWRDIRYDSIYTQLGMNLLQTEQIGNLKIEMTEEAILKNIGKPDQVSQAIVWDTDGLVHQDWFYKNQGIELNVCWENSNQKTLFRISIFEGCKLETSRKIKIGSSRAQVSEAYKKEIDPRNKENTPIIVGSAFGGIFFDLENDKVVAIFMGAAAE